jgi:putative transposase
MAASSRRVHAGCDSCWRAQEERIGPRRYAAYPLSLRKLEEMMAERGVLVDHATVHRWSLKMLPVPAKVFRRRKHSVGRSWRIDETYVLVG